MAIVGGSSTPEALQIFADATCRIACRDEVADDGDRAGAGRNHLRRRLQGDAADSHHGPPVVLGGAPHALDADG
jgi:hypothetical protein